MVRKYKTVVFLSLWLSFIRIDATDVNYCNLPKCFNGSPHTICSLKHNCSVNLKNCRNFEEVLLRDSDKQLLLELHNVFRSLVATGKASPGLREYRLPTASDMKEMVWDKELEFIAQCWANQCSGGHDMCRTKSDGTVVGQNIAFDTRTDHLKNMIQEFYNEIKYITEKDLTSYGSSLYKIGHFTQLVYYNSSQLGCGRVRYKLKDGFNYNILVCNYAKAGNLKYTKIYTKGQPCASCPKSCHAKYPGLCKTPLSSSTIPNICPYSENKNCKPILQSSQDERKYKSGAQELPHGIFNYFGIKLLTTAVALFSTIVEC